MFSGMIFFTKDPVWRQILSDLGAAAVEHRHKADVVFSPPPKKLSPIELKAEFLNQLDAQRKSILDQIFGGRKADISPMQEKIVLLLFKHNGLSIKQLNEYLGYSTDTKTHTTETAIYQLRKIFGTHFIKNDNGIYKLETSNSDDL